MKKYQVVVVSKYMVNTYGFYEMENAAEFFDYCVKNEQEEKANVRIHLTEDEYIRASYNEN